MEHIIICIFLGAKGILIANFFGCFLESKFQRKSFFMSAFVFSATSILVYCFTDKGIVAADASAFGLLLFFVFVNYKRNVKMQLFSLVSAFAIDLIFSLTSAGFMNLATRIQFLDIKKLLEKGTVLSVSKLKILVWIEINVPWIIVLVMILIGMYISFRRIDKCYQCKDIEVKSKTYFLLFIPMLCGLMSSYFMVKVYSKAIENESIIFLDVLIILFSFLMILCIVVVVQLFSDMLQFGEERKEAKMLAIQLAWKKEHLKEVEDIYGGIRSMNHDIRNHLNIIRNLVEQDPKEAERYVASAEKVLTTLELKYSTGNPVIDVLLNQKCKEAERKHINFSNTFKYPMGANLDAFDLSVLLSNALDNAIEAASKAENKRINVSSKYKKHMFLITIKNSYQGELKFDSDGMPITTKGHEHGIGIRNMKQVAEKYLGNMEYEVTEKEVCFTAMLQLKRETYYS